MSTYTIHQPPLRAGEASPDPERFRFVRDGFYFWAFVFGPVWMLRHRLWLVLLLYFVGMVLLTAGLWVADVPRAVPFVYFLVAVLLGIEAATLRRWTLARRGWKTLGVVVGDDLESAERRFFDAWIKDDGDDRLSTAPVSPPSPQPPRRIPTQPGPGVLGLFPEPGAPR